MIRQRVLAVDDEPHMLRLLERIITEKTDYEITTTHTSLEVFELLKRQHFDVIITDLNMPAIGGMEILDFISENNRHELVLLITAFGSLDSATEALSRGAFDYITKPFRKEHIMHKLDVAMTWQRRRHLAARMEQLFGCEPYAKAVEQFEREYVLRMAARLGREVEPLAERSGIPLERVVRLLEGKG